jgi:hypothetical protein
MDIISLPVDALHLYTAWIRDCDPFIFQDKYLSKMIPKEYEPESHRPR